MCQVNCDCCSSGLSCVDMCPCEADDRCANMWTHSEVHESEDDSDDENIDETRNS